MTLDNKSIVNDVNIYIVQYSEIDREKGLLISHDQYMLLKNGDKPKIHTNSFSLQIYTAQELQIRLIRNGFKIVDQYDIEGNNFIADKSLAILTVAKKQKS